MTTVEQIRAEIEAFKADTVAVLDNFASQRYITPGEADGFLAAVGIERPETPEVRAAREELAALKARVRAEIQARETDGYRRDRALQALGL